MSVEIIEECKREYYENGNIHIEAYYTNGIWHREEDNPTSIFYSSDGKICTEIYGFNNKNSREGDKPAIIEYYKMVI